MTPGEVNPKRSDVSILLPPTLKGKDTGRKPGAVATKAGLTGVAAYVEASATFIDSTSCVSRTTIFKFRLAILI